MQVAPNQIMEICLQNHKKGVCSWVQNLRFEDVNNIVTSDRCSNLDRSHIATGEFGFASPGSTLEAYKHLLATRFTQDIQRAKLEKRKIYEMRRNLELGE